jgi:ABC-type polysaccharide/polyol phosphate export permease
VHWFPAQTVGVMRNRSTWTACLAGMVIGLVILAVPTLMAHGWPGSFSKLLRDVVERMGMIHLYLLFLSGVVWGLVVDKPYSRWGAASQLSFFPIFAILQMFQDPTSHNLWPLEFMIYGFLAMVALAGVKSVELITGRLRTSTPRH